MVKGYNGKSWMFPKGKINEDEPLLHCAIRETIEEIGFDIGPYVDEATYIDYELNGKPVRLYIILNVPETTAFGTKTRNEISVRILESFRIFCLKLEICHHASLHI